MLLTYSMGLGAIHLSVVSCSSLLSVVVVKHFDQNQFEKERVICVPCLSHSSSLKPRQELKQAWNLEAETEA